MDPRKLIINFIINNGARIGKSVVNAYQQVIKSKFLNKLLINHSNSIDSGAAAAGAAGGKGGGQKADPFSKMKEQMGMIAGRPMTHDEAL